MKKPTARRLATLAALLLVVGTAAACGPTGTTATSLSVGPAYSCGIVSGGNVKCWGSNGWNQLGDGSGKDSNAPVAVAGVTGATALATGESHACALVADGNIMCWGRDDSGQLGSGTTVDSSPPVAVTGITGATAIAAGENHTCAIVAGGVVKCWGYNLTGQLGNNKTTNSNVPVTVTGVTGATALSAGWSHSCAIIAGGAVDCWGADDSGQLGNGVTGGVSKVAVAVTGLTGATAIVSGNFHNCVLVADGAVQCWGRNTYYGLGNGSNVLSNVPVSAAGITGATAISAGGFQSCALVGGVPNCWGDDYYGQLGNGLTSTVSPTPIAPVGVTGATAISTGGSHTCALVSGGAIKCWGDNGFGELGHGPVNIDAVSYNVANTCTDASCNGGTGETDVAADITAGGAKADIYAIQQACSDRTNIATAIGTAYRTVDGWDTGTADGGACGSSTTSLGNELYVSTVGLTTWTPTTVDYNQTDSPAHRNFTCVHTQVKGAPTMVCNTQLAPGADPSIATEETTELLNWVQAHRQNFEAVVVAGSFNLAPSAGGTGWDQAWRNAGFTDANTSALPTSGGAETDYLWIVGGTAPAATVSLGQHSNHQAVRVEFTPYFYAASLPVSVA